ncbi:NADH:flavin oxidoreductase/NADH oxidase family protein [uncultured Tateyamaria sp.]|uniref:NADH:flavin oxidoreductase/NADH oxidase family protein n=1 Tax=uncultured Tateyamaria sp. TaxID=455651 RepID=UPI0026162A47|nr:NADH:flavin oxidoreductase/NADH oxidase family protein [uncultured Tateyamaria sp.]
MPSPLSDPIVLPCGATIKNRFCKSAMTEAFAGPDDAPNAAHVTLYDRWAQGGVGLQITGNVMVDRRYLERPGNVVIEDDRDMDMLRAWAAAGKSAGGQIWMQISHPGRQCPIVVNTRPLSPSAEKLQILGLFGKPKAMTTDDIDDAIRRYATAARTAQAAGFDGVQIHAAHGYLISQFLSPITNRRSDDWGGSIENRARFLRAVYAAIRTEVGPQFPVAVKLNSSDFQKGGFTIEESCAVARLLESDGIDLIELSGGSYEQMSFVTGDDADTRRDSTRKREAYFLHYARAVRAAVSVPLVVTGGFRTRAAMEEAVRDHGIDGIGLARPLCVHPDAVNALLSGDDGPIGIQEDGLTIGRGRLGVNARNWLVNLVNTVSRVEYHGWQMTRMSRGLAPDSSGRNAAILWFLWYLNRTTMKGLRRKFVR